MKSSESPSWFSPTAKCVIAAVSAGWLTLACGQAAPAVNVSRVPEGGLQPQAVAGADGTVHLVYFKGDPKAGDLFYARRAPGSGEFGPAIRVNSRPGDAIALGTIRGPQIALGRNGRLHVAWNGSDRAQKHGGAPMWYTRLAENGRSFEPERDVMSSGKDLDGGGSVAADPFGQVYVVWHARPPGAEDGEDGRALFVAVSSDDGKAFSTEREIKPRLRGVCACCGLKAFAAPDGKLYVLYRAEREGTQRPERVLVSTNHAASFQVAYEHPWKATTCPMSSASVATGRGSAEGAWETLGRVWFASFSTTDRPQPIAPAEGTNQKYPALAQNGRGQTLLAWAEETAWAKGGRVAWELFDAGGHSVSAKQSGPELPAWSLPATWANRDGSFEIVY